MNIGLSDGFPIEVNVSKPFTSKPDSLELKRMTFTRMRIGSVDELAGIFQSGRSCCNMIQDWCYTAGVLKNSARRKSNWNGSRLVVLDVDGNDTGLTLNEIVKRLPHRPHVAYRTFSCAEDRDNKFRLVYVTDIITDAVTFRTVWWILDQELRETTGLTGKVYKDGRVTASDYMLQCPVQLFHGARPGSEVIKNKIEVYQAENLIVMSQKINSSFSHAESRPRIPGGSNTENELLINFRYNSTFEPSDTDMIVITDCEKLSHTHKADWVSLELRKFTGEFLYGRFMIRHTPLPDCDREPENRNIIYIKNPDEYYEMPVYYRFGRPSLIKKGFHRPANLFYDAVRFRVIRPDINFTDLVVNLLIRLEYCYDWYNGGDDPIRPSHIRDIAINALSLDMTSVNPSLLFEPCDKEFIVDTWGQLRDDGVDISKSKYRYYEMSEEDQAEFLRIRRKGLKTVSNRLIALARKIRADVHISEVYDPMLNVSRNSEIIKAEHPDVPHSKNRLRRYCEEHGINPCPVNTRGGRRTGAGRRRSNDND